MPTMHHQLLLLQIASRCPHVAGLARAALYEPLPTGLMASREDTIEAQAFAQGGLLPGRLLTLWSVPRVKMQSRAIQLY